MSDTDLEVLLDHLDKAREAIAQAQHWAEVWKAHAFRMKAERDALKLENEQLMDRVGVKA